MFLDDTACNLASINLVKLYDDALCPLKGKGREDVDFVVFRENTEGAYVGVGGNFKQGTADEVAIQAEVHTRKGVERILRAAFDYARSHGRREVCMADKSNVMQFAHGLWQRAFAEVGDWSETLAKAKKAHAAGCDSLRKTTPCSGSGPSRPRPGTPAGRGRPA